MKRSQFLKEVVVEKLTTNYEKMIAESGSASGDISTYGQLILPLVKKIYPEMLTTQIADVQPLTSPVARIAALFSYYKPTAPNGSADANFSNCRIITIAGDHMSEFATGQSVTITTSGGTPATRTGTVLYSEKSQYPDLTSTINVTTVYRTNILIRFDSPAPDTSNTAIDPVYLPVLISDTITGGGAGRTVISTTINRTAIKKIFHHYSEQTDEYAAPREANTVVRTVTVPTKTRKLKTKLTPEQIQDYRSIYGQNAEVIIAEILGNDIKQEIDMEVIEYLKSIATPLRDVIYLGNSYGRQGDLMAVADDIYMNIFYAAEQIVRATKRNRTMFVMVDAVTLAMLKTSPLHITVASTEEDNPFHVGTIGPYNLYCDIYSDEHYCLVGYQGTGQGDGDTGLIYAPYVDFITNAVNPDTFGTNVMYMSRYAYCRHPQDQLKDPNGIGDSDFFRIFSVDFANPVTVGFEADSLRQNGLAAPAAPYYQNPSL